MPNRRFTEDEITFLKEHYEEYVSHMRLSELAEELQRTRTTICKKARQLGLTDNKRIYLRANKN